MKKMEDLSVVIDILHYPHVNFYKHTIEILEGENIKVHVILRPRGNLVSIFKKECPNISYVLIGEHKKNMLGKMIDMAERDIAFLKFLNKIKFDVGTGIGSISLAHTTRFFRKPSILFGDDIEEKLSHYLGHTLATWDVRPKCVPAHGKNLLQYNGFKELAYLHPKYFKPNVNILDEYNIDPYKYVFIREVSNVSLNYRNMEMGKLSKILDYLKEMDLKILLSIEDKSLVDLFEGHCIILEEPMEDIHSLLSYANFTLSSGDSMARESCLVGTPAIYTGGRDMAINNELIKRECMFKVDDKDSIEKKIKYVVENDIKTEVQNKINRAIKDEWVDTTEVIHDILMGTLTKDSSLIEKYKT